MGVLSSRYDIYQDVMDPANFPKLGYVHPDWTSDALAQRHHSARRRIVGSGLGRGGQGGGVVPLRRAVRRLAVDYARRRVPEELETHPVSLPLHRHDDGRRVARMLSSQASR